MKRKHNNHLAHIDPHFVSLLSKQGYIKESKDGRYYNLTESVNRILASSLKKRR